MCLGTVIVVFGITSVHRNGIWRDELTLWCSTVNREPNSARAHHNLGVVHSLKASMTMPNLNIKRRWKLSPGMQSHTITWEMPTRGKVCSMLLSKNIRRHCGTIRFMPMPIIILVVYIKTNVISTGLSNSIKKQPNVTRSIPTITIILDLHTVKINSTKRLLLT